MDIFKSGFLLGKSIGYPAESDNERGNKEVKCSCHLCEMNNLIIARLNVGGQSFIVADITDMFTDEKFEKG